MRYFCRIARACSSVVPTGPVIRRSLVMKSRTGRFRSFFRRHRALAVGTALAPTLAAAALIVYLELRGGGAPGIEVVSEQYAPMVIETDDGPLILLGGADEPEGT